jgi:hypothetical protein
MSKYGFFLNEKLMYVAVFKLVSPCFSIIYSAKKLPTAIAINI